MARAIALLAALLAALLIGLWFVGDGSGPAREEAPDAARPGAPGDSGVAASTPADIAALPGPDAVDEGATDGGPEGAREGIPDLPPERLTAFRGAVVLQPSEAERTVEANAGRFDLEVVRKGQREQVVVPIVGGRFSIDVPRDGRVRLGAGELDGAPVHFEEPVGLFAPADLDYLLVGVPSERITLDVVDGATGAPLDGVTVTRTGSSDLPLRLEGAPRADRGDRLAAGAPSPVELPRIDADGPVWLHVGAEGYATTALLVDPRASERREVRLWPSADLDLALAGPRRTEVRIVVVTRVPQGGAAAHAGTVDVTGPAIERLPSTNVARLRGLAAVRTRFEAKGFDARGRVVDLGSVEVDLGPGEMKRAELPVQ